MPTIQVGDREVMSSNSIRTSIFTLKQIPLEKAWTPLSLPNMGLIVKLFFFYFDDFDIR